jgi:hypothetical protein
VEPSNCRGFFFGLGKRSMRYGEGRFLFHLRMGEGDLHQHLEHVNSQQLREPITRFKNIISEVRNCRSAQDYFSVLRNTQDYRS